MLIIDFETKSRCNLLTAGAYNYAADDSTDIICMAAINAAGKTWIWYAGDELPESLLMAIDGADLIAAHNAEFDRLIWEYVGVNLYNLPEIDSDKWYCTATQARVNGLPTSLDNAAWAMNLNKRKSYTGKNLIKELSIPAEGRFVQQRPAANTGHGSVLFTGR